MPSTNQKPDTDDDPYDLNNQSPKLVKKQVKKIQNTAIEEEYSFNRSESPSDRVLSSPESVLKFDFKSSTPIVVKQKSKTFGNDERNVPSPKFKKQSEKNKIRNFSPPCKSIFDKKTMSKVSLSSFNEKKFGSQDSLDSDSNYQIRSKVFKKKFEDLSLNNSISEPDLKNDPNSSLESVLMEPFLNKFEEELLKNSKSEVIKDLSQLNQAKSNLFQKYFKEIKNLTLKKSSPLKYDLSDEEKEPISKEKLKSLSKSQVPWQSLDYDSANTLLESVVQNLNTHLEEYPILFSKKGNKISQNQIKKWHDLLENLTLNELKSSKQTSNSNKQYLMNKKRQLIDKVSKKTSKTLSDLSHSCSELTKSVSKLYANVLVEDKEKEKEKETSKKKSKKKSLNDTLTDAISIGSAEILLTETKSKHKNQKLSSKVNDPVLEESQYVNENFFIKNDKANLRKTLDTNHKTKASFARKSTSKDLNESELNHFYNEIAESEMRSRQRQRERKREEEEETNESKKNLSDSMTDSATNLIFKKNVASIAKLKSPERRILYKDWFAIIKRMEKDPNFDLETLVRTRGRFTEHENIAYRDKLRCAKSEPNFGTFNLLSQQQTSMAKARSGINTAPARNNFDPGQKRLRRNFSDNTTSTANKPDLNSNEALKQKPVKKNSNKETKVEEVTVPSASALKLTLEKSDINRIKEILKKKDKSVIQDLTYLKVKTNQRKLLKKNELLSN